MKTADLLAHIAIKSCLKSQNVSLTTDKDTPFCWFHPFYMTVCCAFLFNHKYKLDKLSSKSSARKRSIQSQNYWQTYFVKINCDVHLGQSDLAVCSLVTLRGARTQNLKVYINSLCCIWRHSKEQSWPVQLWKNECINFRWKPCAIQVSAQEGKSELQTHYYTKLIRTLCFDWQFTGLWALLANSCFSE